MHGFSCRSMHFTFLVGTFNGDVEYRMQDKVIFEPYSTRFRKIRITSLRMLKRYSLKHYATAWVIKILGYSNAAAGAHYATAWVINISSTGIFQCGSWSTIWLQQYILWNNPREKGLKCFDEMVRILFMWVPTASLV